MLYGVAVALAFAPTLELFVAREDLGFIHFANAYSPWSVAVFLVAGSLHALFDFMRETRREGQNQRPGKISVSTVDSPGAISAIYGHTVVVQQGVSDDTIRAIVRQTSQLVDYVVRHADAQTPTRQEPVLIWRLIDDIKNARRRFETVSVTRLVAQLEELWSTDGRLWRKELQREAILILAEGERGRFLDSKKAGEPYDLSRLKKLLSNLEELENE